MNNIGILFVVCVALLVTPARAEDFSVLQTMVETAREAAGLPSGTAVAIIKGDRIIYEGYFGYADIKNGVKVDENTAFYIASSTKPFFALSVLLLTHEGRLDAEASLQSLFPQTKFQGFDAGAVTVRDLLVHTAGLDNDAMVWATAFSGVHDAVSRRQLVAATYPNEESPQGVFDYSNVGYNILSVALDERGDAWQERLREDVFAPLGMKRTSAYMSDARRNGWSVARPYSLMSEHRREALYLEKIDATMHAAGGMVSTARDLARFLVAQLNEGHVDGKQVFPPAVIERSQARQATTDAAYNDFKRDGYAWGWYTGEYKGRRMLHHFGGFAGFHAHLSFIPEEKVGLVVLNNEDFLSAKLTALIADAAYGTLFDEPEISAKTIDRLADMLTKIRGVDATVQKRRQEIAARPWRLSEPRTEYAGSYSNDTLGRILVEARENAKLAFKWGELHAVADGYDMSDVVRVEFVPNSGELVSFVVENGTVRALVIDGITFGKE